MNEAQMKAFFENDRFAARAGAQIQSISKDAAVCTLLIEAHHLNAGGRVQGGAIFTLADFAFAVACNYYGLSENNNTITVNQSSNILFFKPPAGMRLIATARCVQKGKTLSVYRIEVADELGTQVAEMTGNAYTVKLPPASKK